jgi:glycosyltransferase involved in cell wall biosynthesis
VKKVLYFIQVPPPIHGVSTINKYVLESEIINQNIEKKLLEIKFSNSVQELTHFSFSKFFKFIKLFFSLFKTLFSFKPDFVYFSIMPVGKGFYRDFIYVLLMKLFRTKIIFHIHNSGINDKKHSFIKSKMYKCVFDNSFIIHLSEGLLQKEIMPLNLKNAKLFAVNNGVEIVEFQKSKIEKSKVNILFLSNLFPEKGVFTILNVFKDLFVENTNIQLDIIGENFLNENKKIREFIFNNKLENSVFLHENIHNENRFPFFEKADIFAFPSQLKCESFPLVLLEAMMFKLPVVAYEIGAVAEIVKNTESGFVAELGNILEFKTKLKTLIENTELRTKFGEKAQEIYFEKYTKKVFEKNMKITFESLL